jgi:hypothetical protein
MTNRLVTVLTFTYSHELAIVRGRLEFEGIECFVKDEFTAQVNPFYSNAIGGIKLQVKESDLENAVEILKELGYIKDSNLQPSKFFTKIDNYTVNIPLINRLGVEIRLMLIVTLLLGLIIGLIYYLTLPTNYERLTSNSWCIENVIYKGENYIPKTENFITFVVDGYCEEKITFRDNGDVTLPGLILKRLGVIGDLIKICLQYQKLTHLILFTMVLTKSIFQIQGLL